MRRENSVSYFPNRRPVGQRAKKRRPQQAAFFFDSSDGAALPRSFFAFFKTLNGLGGSAAGRGRQATPTVHWPWLTEKRLSCWRRPASTVPPGLNDGARAPQ
jgi:hypothetical protein